jgi:hypothetical protein
MGRRHRLTSRPSAPRKARACAKREPRVPSAPLVPLALRTGHGALAYWASWIAARPIPQVGRAARSVDRGSRERGRDLRRLESPPVHQVHGCGAHHGPRQRQRLERSEEQPVTLRGGAFAVTISCGRVPHGFGRLPRSLPQRTCRRPPRRVRQWATSGKRAEHIECKPSQPR